MMVLVDRSVLMQWPLPKRRAYLRHPSLEPRCKCRIWCVAYGNIRSDSEGEDWHHSALQCQPYREYIQPTWRAEL